MKTPISGYRWTRLWVSPKTPGPSSLPLSSSRTPLNKSGWHYHSSSDKASRCTLYIWWSNWQKWITLVRTCRISCTKLTLSSWRSLSTNGTPPGPILSTRYANPARATWMFVRTISSFWGFWVNRSLTSPRIKWLSSRSQSSRIKWILNSLVSSICVS